MISDVPICKGLFHLRFTHFFHLLVMPPFSGFEPTQIFFDNPDESVKLFQLIISITDWIKDWLDNWLSKQLVKYFCFCPPFRQSQFRILSYGLVKISQAFREVYIVYFILMFACWWCSYEGSEHWLHSHVNIHLGETTLTEEKQVPIIYIPYK